jgi:tight adherence protein B
VKLSSSIRQSRLRRAARSLLGAASLTAVLAVTGTSVALAAPAPETPAATTIASPAPAGLAPTVPANNNAGIPHLVIAIDNSSRFSNQQFEASKTAARLVLNSLPTAQAAIVSFGGPGTTIYPPGPVEGAVTALDQLSQNSGELEAVAAQSQLTEGLALGVDTIKSMPSPKAVVLVTDGTNNGSVAQVEQARQSALSSGVAIAIIDTRPPGDLDTTKQKLITELLGVKGAIVPVAKTDNMKEITAAILKSGLEPSELALRPEGPGIGTRILSSNLILLVGALLIGGAIFFGAMQAIGPKEVKVNLTGIPVAPKQAKDLKTPMAGLANKLTDLAEKRLEDSGKQSGIQAWLERAAINLRSGEYIVVTLVGTLALVGVMWLFKGIIWALLMIFVGPFLSRFIVNRKAKKRTKRFGEQLSDTLQLISSSMRAGQGFMQALDAVARESESPTSEEFQRVVVEARLGRDLVDSMKALAHRIECEDLEWVIPAVEINREVGGDLAEVLEQVGATIRDRADLRRQVKTLSAEGRLSAVVLIGLPIVLGLFIKMSNPEYMDPLFHGAGLYMVGAATLMMLIGSIWLFNICKIEF